MFQSKICFFFFFFSCIAERARGMVGQLSRYAKAKRVKLELLAGVFSPAGKQSNQKQHNKPPNSQKGAGENPRKSGETCAPPKASHFISSTL